MKEMRKTIKDPAHFKNWMVVYWADQKGYETAETFYETVTKCSKAYGIKVNEPQWVEIGDSKKKCDAAAQIIKEEFMPECQIVVVILNRYTKMCYPQIKKVNG